MNTFSTTGQSRRPSRLVEIMRSLAGSHGVPGFGFKQPFSATRRVTALVASFPEVDPEGMAAAADAGADAVEARIAGANDLRRAVQLAERLKVPFGVALPADAGTSFAASAAEVQADWIRLPLDSRISTLEWEKPAHVLTVPFDLDLHLSRGLSGLAVDVVLIDAIEPSRSELTYSGALRIRTMSELMRKPLLLRGGPGVPPAAAGACEHLGVDGLLVDMEDLRSIDLLRDYLRALEMHAERR